MRKWAIFFGALVACGEGAAIEGELSFDVGHYDYRFDIETRQATSALTLEATSDGDCLTIRLRTPPLAIRIDGDDVGGEWDGASLSTCGTGWSAGDSLILEVDVVVAEETWQDTQVGYSVTADSENAPFHYLVSWIEGCDRFGPCDSRPDQFATYRFVVTHPTGMDVLCPGDITASANETQCVFSTRAPTYSSFGFAASPSWVKSDIGPWAGIDVALYDMPSTGLGANFDRVTHSQFLEWMAERFGPYPYGDELRIATGPTHWNGFEHPGNILLNDTLHTRLFSYADPLTHVTNHEIAHMWAGNRTTLASVGDFAWKEAVVEYLVFAFEDEVQSRDIAERTARYWRKIANGAEYFPVPTEPPPLVDFYGDAYGATPLILFRQLEALFSRDAVMSALAALLTQETALSVSDIEVALANSVGVDLSAYFGQWLHGAGVPAWPRFEVSFVQDQDDVFVTVEQLGDDLFGCAFAVAVTGENGESTELWFDLGVSGTRTLTLATTANYAVTGTVLDPHGHALVYEAASVAAAPANRINPWVSPTP